MAPASSSRTTTTIAIVTLVRRCISWTGQLHPRIHHLTSKGKASHQAARPGRSVKFRGHPMHTRLISPHRFSLRPCRFAGIVAVILLPFTSGFAPAQQAHPNAQLADPKIEAGVNALLQQMTLEEKVGQLVQYGGQPVAHPPTSGKKKEGAAAVNPEAQQPDPMTLVENGMLGTVLN